jgi:hypothetical protein
MVQGTNLEVVDLLYFLRGNEFLEFLQRCGQTISAVAIGGQQQSRHGALSDSIEDQKIHYQCSLGVKYNSYLRCDDTVLTKPLH